MNASARLFLRRNYITPEGKHPVCLRVIINRNQKIYSSGINLYPEDLMKNDKFLVKSSIEDASLINIQLRDIENRANEILNDFARFNIPPTFLEFNKRYKNNLSRESFHSYAKQYIKRNIEFSKETIRTYNSQLSKLDQFIPQSQQTFQEINNLDFIEAYKKYMIEELGNKLNTYSKSLAFIRTVLNDAKKNSIISKTVFDKIKIKRERGNRHFLTMDEIDKLSKYYHSKTIIKKHKNVLQYFLFSCFCGLRFTDIKNLRFEHIKKHTILNKDKRPVEQLFIDLKMHKTKLMVLIPVIERAATLIDLKDSSPVQFVFHVLSNQKTNKFLKQILIKLEIDQAERVSYHSSRHTFATHAIRMGMPIKSVSLALGHTAVRTTEIYTHLIKDDLFNEMDKAFK